MQVLNQLAAVGITVLLAVAGTFALLKIVDLLIGVRVSEADEIEGLDLSQHGEEGYNTDLELIPALASHGTYGTDRTDATHKAYASHLSHLSHQSH